MSREAFHHPEPLTLGVELELQLVNTNDYDLAPYAEDMCVIAHPTHSAWRQLAPLPTWPRLSLMTVAATTAVFSPTTAATPLPPPAG